MSAIYQFAVAESPIFGRYPVNFVIPYQKYFAIAIVCLLTGRPSFAQSERIDSLTNVLSQLHHDDTAKVRVLAELAFQLVYVGDARSVARAREVIDLSKRIKSGWGISRGYYVLAYHARFIRQDIDSALVLFEIAAEKALAIGDSSRYATCLLQISGLHSDQLKHETAQEYALKAKDVIEAGTNYRNSGLAYEVLAGIYVDKEDFVSARLYLQKAYDKYKRNQNTGLLLQVSNSLANFYLLQNHADSALAVAHNAISFAKQKKLFGFGASLAYCNKGEALIALGRSDSALHYLMLSESLLGADNSDVVRARLYYNVGKAHIELKDYVQAERFLRKSLERTTPKMVRSISHDPNFQLARLFEMKGDLKRALNYYKKHHQFNDSVTRVLNKISLLDVQTRYESTKREKENEKLKMDLMFEKATARNRSLQLWLAISTSALGLVIICLQHRSRQIIARKNQLLSEQNREIQTQNEEIVAQNEEISMQTEQLKMKNDFLELQNEKLEEINREKDGLMSIVAHDLRAPLNRTKGLVGLLKTRASEPEDLVFIQKILQITDEGLSLIRDILEVNYAQHETGIPKYQSVNLKKFIEDDVVKPFTDAASKKSIQIFSALAHDTEIVTDPSALKRILENLLSNAIKFSPSSSRVFIRTSNTTDKVLIGVQDEGPGISAEDQKKMFRKFQRLTARPTGGEHSTGLGLAIVKALVVKLNGEITVETDLDAGTEFIVKLPISMSAVHRVSIGV